MTTVRSQAKADKIQEAKSKYGRDKLDFAIVEDIAQPDAFEKAVISDPPFEAVIHTASPFHFNVTDTKKDLLDPAVVGTTGILKAIKKSAPTVKRVVITSSFAAILDPNRKPGYEYSEKDWNPITEEEALENPTNGYRASKTFAERAAWEFVEKEKPNFTLATVGVPSEYYLDIPLTDLAVQPSHGLRTRRPLPQLPRRRQHLQPADPRHHDRRLER